jgi:hypothetical protein
MTNNMDPALDAKNATLFQLLMPHRASDVLQRINLWVVNRTGKKLPDYIANGAAVEDKLKLVAELTEIVEKEQWDKLPKVPNGQATPAATSTKAATTKPAAIIVVPPPQPPPAAEKPALPKPELPLPTFTPVVSVPAPKPVAPVVMTHTSVTPDAATQLANLLAQLMPAPQPAAPGMTDDQVRRVVRTELADLFTKIAAVLSK